MFQRDIWIPLLKTENRLRRRRATGGNTCEWQWVSPGTSLFKPKCVFRQPASISAMPKSKVLSVIVCVGVVFTLNILYRHGYPDSRLRSGTSERQGLVEDRFRSRRERVLKTCRTARNKEDVVCTINTRVLYFWNYNASICTMGKVSCTAMQNLASLHDYIFFCKE